MLIEVKNLRKVYQEGNNELEVLKGVSFNIEKGEFISIMGPSGSGKTTLMNMLGCLDSPTDGLYKLDGEEINKLGKDQLAEIRSSKIGFVFQNFNLLPRLNALENVEIPMLYQRVTKGERLKKALEVLGRVDLEDRVRHLPTQLSGGQKQRVAIARALINSPRIILADEPTGNLDSKSGDAIINLFKGLHKEGVTLILVTHDVTVARKTERIINVRDGEIVLDKKVGVPL